MSSSMMQYLVARTERMQAKAFEGIDTLSDWQAVRAERRRELLANLSLNRVPGWPPEKAPDGESSDTQPAAPATPLRHKSFGEISGQGYRMMRIGFEIMPDCWSSACLYYPDPLPAEPAPGVLYVCGHAEIGVHHYQYNPLMWARRGYVCLIVDTIEQSDNPGEHHGYNVGLEDRWLALGYTSAGGELLNSLRALDVLAADPAVDANRLATTGISGGGALSFYLAMVDERIKAVSTLCGISTPADALGRRRMFGHCDCFYPLNLFGRDTADYAALIAPRAALFCFGDNDALFHPEETRSLVDRTRRIYTLYGAADNCRLLSHTCGHENHPVFYRATQEWFDRHVAGDQRPLIEVRREAELDKPQVMAFNGAPPSPNYLALLPHLMCPRGNLPLPVGPDDWPELRTKALAGLPRPTALARENPPVFTEAGEWRTGQNVTGQHQGRLDGVDLWLETVAPLDGAKRLILSVANPGEYGQVVRGAVTGAALACHAALVALEPRIAGGDLPPRSPTPEPLGTIPRGVRNRLILAMALNGLTPVTLTVHDLLAALAYTRKLTAFSDFEICLHGRAEGAVSVLHAALCDDQVSSVILEDPPVSHADGAPVPGILGLGDIPELVGLLAPRHVAVINPAHGNWNWPAQVFQRIGCNANLCIADTLDAGCRHVFRTGV